MATSRAETDAAIARRGVAAGLATKIKAAIDRGAIADNAAATAIAEPPQDQSEFAITFAGLGPDHCKNPLGDPQDRDDFRFCGRPRFGKEPYCLRHCVMNYTPYHRRSFNTYDPTTQNTDRKPTARGGVMDGAWT